MQQAYEKLKFYQDICNIRRFIQKLVKRFDSSHIRLVSQMRDSARSAKQNIREGYRRGSAAEFARSIKISQGSLEELNGDMEDCLEDGLISEEEYKYFIELFRSASYLSTQYLKSLYELEHQGKWRSPAR